MERNFPNRNPSEPNRERISPFSAANPQNRENQKGRQESPFRREQLNAEKQGDQKHKQPWQKQPSDRS